ncbi:hypothetical protein ACWCQ0_41530 [Streptomyces massasporeus]
MLPRLGPEQVVDLRGRAAGPGGDVEDLVVPVGVLEAAATVLRTARELLRQSYCCYEFSTVAVMHSLIAVEIVLRDRIPDAGKKLLHQLIKQGAVDGILTTRQAEYLDYGRQIRNGMAHGQTTHAVTLPLAAAALMLLGGAAVPRWRPAQLDIRPFPAGRVRRRRRCDRTESPALAAGRTVYEAASWKSSGTP